MKATGWQKFDYTGFILLIIWISSFQVMVDNGQKNGWFGSPYICRLGITSLISFIALLWWELKNKEPLFDLKIFKNWNFTFGTIILTVVFAVAYGSIAILPQFLQSMLGYTSCLSGLAAMPMGVGSILGTLLTAVTSKKLELRGQILMGICFFAAGCYLFSVLNLNISMESIILPNVILGIGMTSVIIPATTIVYSYVSKEETTNASSLQNLVKNIGCAVGTSSVTVLVQRYAQIHRAHLVDRMTMLNSAFPERISDLSANFMQMGMDSFSALHMAQAKIYNQLVQQSTLCAYMTSYKVYALLTILVMPLVFILKRCNQK